MSPSHPLATLDTDLLIQHSGELISRNVWPRRSCWLFSANAWNPRCAVGYSPYYGDTISELVARNAPLEVSRAVEARANAKLRPDHQPIRG